MLREMLKSMSKSYTATGCTLSSEGKSATLSTKRKYQVVTPKERRSGSRMQSEP